MAGRNPLPLADRLMNKVQIGESPFDCWLWTGSVRHGYGQIRLKAGDRWTVGSAHRVSYELAVGSIPEGLDLDHLCRTTTCVNPDHLEPVTRKVNVLRGEGPAAVNARKVLCGAGHEYGEARFPNGRRRCLVCHPHGVTGAGACTSCGSPLQHRGHGRQRRFCSDSCRITFHNQRRRKAGC